jgi:hypothetical protein
VQTVKPALDKFYASLSEEQKQRFDALGPKQEMKTALNNSRATVGSSSNDKQACNDTKSGLANVPMQQIEQTLKPTEAQQAEFKRLQDATNKAVDVLQNACPSDVPATPAGRLDAMDQRLKAMIEAATTIKPALDGFYSSLDAGQKARFNRLDKSLAKSG